MALTEVGTKGITNASIKLEDIENGTTSDAGKFLKNVDGGAPVWDNIDLSTFNSAVTFNEDVTFEANSTNARIVFDKSADALSFNTWTYLNFRVTDDSDVGTASCDLYITAHFSQSEQANNGDAMSCALFVSGTNDALQVRSHYTSSSGWEHNHAMSFIYKMASWGTTQKTFSIRFGGGDSINYTYPGTGASGSYYSADACKTGFVIEEIAT